MKNLEYPTPSKSLKSARCEWVGKEVKCFVRSMLDVRSGPHIGIVKGISDNQVAAECEGSKEFGETGLLVEIPELGRNLIYGVWPVSFQDAEII